VYRLRKVLPCARDARNDSLATQFPFGTNLARHARNFRSERVEPADHRVYHSRRAQKLTLERAAVDLQVHRLRQITLRYRSDTPRHFRRRLHYIADQAVYGIDAGGPASTLIPEVRALVDPALLTDRIADPS